MTASSAVYILSIVITQESGHCFVRSTHGNSRAESFQGLLFASFQDSHAGRQASDPFKVVRTEKTRNSPIRYEKAKHVKVSLLSVLP